MLRPYSRGRRDGAGAEMPGVKPAATLGAAEMAAPTESVGLPDQDRRDANGAKLRRAADFSRTSGVKTGDRESHEVARLTLRLRSGQEPCPDDRQGAGRRLPEPPTTCKSPRKPGSRRERPSNRLHPPRMTSHLLKRSLRTPTGRKRKVQRRSLATTTAVLPAKQSKSHSSWLSSRISSF